MRETKDFVDISKNVFQTLSVIYGSRFPRGVATFAAFARGPPGYAQALIKCKTSVGVTDYLSTGGETEEVAVTFPKVLS